MIELFLTVLFFLLAVINFLPLVLFFLPDKKEKEFHPPLSVLVPAHNEEKYIEATLRSICEAEYRNKKEIIVIDDGSVDATAKLVRKFSLKNKNVKLLSLKHSGKSAALNHGISKARYEYMAYVDADSYLEKNSLALLVAPLAEKNVAVSSGIIRAKRTGNLLSWFQDIDYIASSSWRYICNKIDASYIAPGFAAFKKSAIKKIGGFSRDTLTEDIDTTLVLVKAGFQASMSKAVMHTSVPSTLRSLIKQRIRWGRGSIQTARKHHDLLFSLKNKRVGFYSFPMHLFWYPFSLLYMPLAVYWMLASYASATLPILSFASLMFFVKWLTVYGIADLFYHVFTGAYGVTPLIASILLSWSFSAVYLLLSMKRFRAFSWQALSYFVIFPYFWITFVIQGFALVYELIANSKGNAWSQ